MKLKRLLLIITVLGGMLVAAGHLNAHPLGNFTISRYSRLQIAPEQINLFYVVDMAEIPTFQHWSQIDLNKDDQIDADEQTQYLTTQTPALLQNLHLTINGEQLQLEPESQTLAVIPGQGELPTLRIEMQFSAPLAATEGKFQGEYQDFNFADRPGWQEIVVQPGADIRLISSSAPTTDLSDGLRQYPDDLLQQPPNQSQAIFSFEPASVAQSSSSDTAVLPATTAQPAAIINDRFSTDEFGDLLATTLSQPGAVVIAIFIALGLGAAHGLTPGHGKTIVGAYLVGSRGTAKHALFLGLTTTITHTAGVFAFGFIVLFAARFILPEQIFPWLGVLSGLLVVIIGASMIRGHLRNLWGGSATSHATAEGYHTHFGIGHVHQPQSDPGWRNLFALGVSGGLIPCPSALILLLSAIALQKVGFGLVLIFFFSIGLAGILTGIGLVLVYANRLFEKFSFGQSRLMRVAPLLSSLFITLAGLTITIRALLAARL